MTLGILDLPSEILEHILSLLRPDLASLVELSSVCSRFRTVCSGLAVPVHIPVTEGMLHILNNRQIPVSTLCNREPAMFVRDQIEQLNTRRLVAAELVAQDYLTNTNVLSPHYVAVLEHLSAQCKASLKHLLVNLDLERERENRLSFRCVRIVVSFKNLTFLSVAFTPNMELQQQILRRRDGQKMIKNMVDNLPKLNSLYLFCCPADKLVIHSESLEKLHVYKSEFTRIGEFRTPALRKLVMHNMLEEFVTRLKYNYANDGRGASNGLFGPIYDGCPVLDSFNSVDLSCLRCHNFSREEWCYWALNLCVKKYRKLLTQSQDYATE